MKRSLEQLEHIADTIKERKAALHTLIIKAAANGGFNPDKVPPELKGFSQNKLMTTCQDLEDQGLLQWLEDGRYIFRNEGFGVQFSETLKIEERDK